jgi:methyl-accepting chemotaxis protein
MDLNTAHQAHSDWKIKLRLAITKKEQLDADTISKDNCCAFGKWLHGEAASAYGRLPGYKDCLGKHAAFHKEAGAVARTINTGQYAKAEAMLGAGTPYAMASKAVGSAILGLKKAVPA